MIDHHQTARDLIAEHRTKFRVKKGLREMRLSFDDRRAVEHCLGKEWIRLDVDGYRKLSAPANA